MIDPRATFAKAKTAADEAASALEVSFAAAKDGAVAINAKGFEALRANADANFEFLKAVLAVKSLPDLITLQTEFARKQVETFASQTKDLGALTQKAMATPSSRSRNKWRNPSRSPSDLVSPFGGVFLPAPSVNAVRSCGRRSLSGKPRTCPLDRGPCNSSA